MSVRAYRVKKIDYNKDCSFNLWHNEKLMRFLEGKGIYNGLNQDGCGITSLETETIRKALMDRKELELEDYVIDALEKDLRVAERKGDTWIDYYCF